MHWTAEISVLKKAMPFILLIDASSKMVHNVNADQPCVLVYQCCPDNLTGLSSCSIPKSMGKLLL